MAQGGRGWDATQSACNVRDAIRLPRAWRGRSPCQPALGAQSPTPRGRARLACSPTSASAYLRAGGDGCQARGARQIVAPARRDMPKQGHAEPPRSAILHLGEINVRSRRSSLDSSRKANREGHEVTRQYQCRQELLGIEELNEEKLQNLLAFISHLEQTPPGAIEVKRRTKIFGKCQRVEGETSGQFHGRLRYWLDRDLPGTKLPRHAPRQTAD